MHTGINELFAGVTGGLGLFVVGMWLLTENLKLLVSRQLRRTASRWTGNRFRAALGGPCRRHHPEHVRDDLHRGEHSSLRADYDPGSAGPDSWRHAAWRIGPGRHRPLRYQAIMIIAMEAASVSLAQSSICCRPACRGSVALQVVHVSGGVQRCLSARCSSRCFTAKSTSTLAVDEGVGSRQDMRGSCNGNPLAFCLTGLQRS